jgi:excisionase family DNA binding protein
MSQLITIEDAARMLACTPAAIRKWLYQRRLPRVKVGRLTRLRVEDVQRIAANGLPGPGTASQRPCAAPKRLQKSVSTADLGGGGPGKESGVP